MAASEPDRYKDLRYPLDIIKDTTDYLSINIVSYTSSLSVSGGDLTGALKIGQKTPTPEELIQLKQQQLAAGNLKVNPAKIGLSERKLKSKVNDYNIILPIPSNIQDGNSVKYTEGSLDGLTANVLGTALGAMQSDPAITIGPQITAALKGIGNLALDPATKEYFTRSLASQAANIPFGGSLTASQLLARQTGNILNPNMELLFDGVTLRTFKFSFKMTPRSPKEATKVKNIIHLLKRRMAPGTGTKGFGDAQSNISGLYLKSPHIFELRYMQGSKAHPFLHKFKPCFLTDMSVNYTGDGTFATYGSADKVSAGTPVSMIMDLSFKELEPIYAGDYDDKDNSVGY